MIIECERCKKSLDESSDNIYDYDSWFWWQDTGTLKVCEDCWTLVLGMLRRQGYGPYFHRDHIPDAGKMIDE